MPDYAHHIFVCCNREAPGHARGCRDPELLLENRQPWASDEREKQ